MNGSDPALRQRIDDERVALARTVEELAARLDWRSRLRRRSMVIRDTVRARWHRLLSGSRRRGAARRAAVHRAAARRAAASRAAASRAAASRAAASRVASSRTADGRATPRRPLAGTPIAGRATVAPVAAREQQP